MMPDQDENMAMHVHPLTKPVPGPNEFSAEQEKQMRLAAQQPKNAAAYRLSRSSQR
jgi:hypothetical protein